MDPIIVNINIGDLMPSAMIALQGEDLVSVQALAAEWVAKHRGELEKKLYDIPAEIDDQIGWAKLAALGLSIDTLTPEQEAYIHSAEA